jgi:retinol dehydrogenase 12
MEKLCLVSGGTSGVGKAIAFGLAERGAEVIILGKNIDRGEAACPFEARRF